MTEHEQNIINPPRPPFHKGGEIVGEVPLCSPVFPLLKGRKFRCRDLGGLNSLRGPVGCRDLGGLIWAREAPPLPPLIGGERRGGASPLPCDDIGAVFLGGGAGVPETLPRVKFADYCPKIAVRSDILAIESLKIAVKLREIAVEYGVVAVWNREIALRSLIVAVWNCKIALRSLIVAVWNCKIALRSLILALFSHNIALLLIIVALRNGILASDETQDRYDGTNDRSDRVYDLKNTTKENHVKR